MADLTSFEGSDVTAAKIEIPDAAGGLREALQVEPVELHLGDEVHVVLHCRVKKVRFDPSTAKHHGGELVRVHVFETIEAAFIDADQVAGHVRENVDRVRKAIEEAQGIQRLDDALEDESDEERADREAELVKAHKMGLHPQTTVVGCPSCSERERDREADARG